MFSGDRNSARLSWGRKTNFSQGKGLPNSRNNPRQGFRPFPDTPFLQLVLDFSLQMSSVLSDLLPWWAWRNSQNLLSPLGQGNKLMCQAAAVPTTRLVGERGSSPRMESLPSLLSPTSLSAPHVLAGSFYSWSFCPASLSLRANCLGSNIPPYLCSQSSLNPSVPQKDNSSCCLLWPVDRFFFPMRLGAPQRLQPALIGFVLLHLFTSDWQPTVH